MEISCTSEANEFDEAYFKGETGSAYAVNDYLATALLSRTYFELADLIATCFKPRRVLEIGCGAGPVIHHLNRYFDVEAFGMDVSTWAVENRLHENVTLGSASNIPFPDRHFDLIFSCHCLEHLPPNSIDEAIAEISRVCDPAGVQVHLLPILGEGPYGDVFGSIVGLRQDPTHNILHKREWWLSRMRKVGWHGSDLRVAMNHDNHSFEFSDCQFILARNDLSAAVSAEIAKWNHAVARNFHHALTRRPPPGLEVYLNDIKACWPG